MNKQAMDIFIAQTKPYEKNIEMVFSQKRDGFICHEEAVMHSIAMKIETYFNDDIIRMISEYVMMYGTLCYGDIIIDMPYTRQQIMRFRLKSMNDFELAIPPTASGVRVHYSTPYVTINTLDQLKNCIKAFEKYEAFEAAIDDDIESMYDCLSDWKTKKMNAEMSELSQISFGDVQQTPVKKKIIIVIEDV